MKNYSYVKTRLDIPELLNKLNLTGAGVEIGVQKGEYSSHLLEHSKLETLYSIDAWEFMPEYKDIANISQEYHDKNFEATTQKLKTYYDQGRSSIFRKRSEQAVEMFIDESLDFIYIDADHSYEGCKKDLHMWYKKLKPGGIFAGHDYLNGKDFGNNPFEVKKAVDEFMQQHALNELYITEPEVHPQGHEMQPGWWFRKPQLTSEKTFGIGLSRTGTTSLCSTFNKLFELKAVHNPNHITKELLDKYRHANDIYVACRFEEIDKMFPNSKFIYTKRDIESWLDSCEAFFGDYMEDWLIFLDEALKRNDDRIAKIDPNTYEFRETMLNLYGTIRFDREKFRQVFIDHDKKVRKYFKDRPDDLLIIDLSDKDKLEKLCKFVFKEENRPLFSGDFFKENIKDKWDLSWQMLPDYKDIVKQVKMQEFRERVDLKSNQDKCVATLCDKKFLPGFEVMLYSLIKNNPQFNWDVVVLSNDLTENDLSEYAKFYPRIRLINFDKKIYERHNKRLQKIYPNHNGSYYKFEAFRLEEYNRVLFLDSDLVILQNIDKLLKFEGDIGMCHELYIDQFNTGVMSIGKKFLNEKIISSLLETSQNISLEEQSRGDQDIINITFQHEDIHQFPIEYNFLKIYHKSVFALSPLSKHIKILHYIINKPWLENNLIPIEGNTQWTYRFWWDYHKKLPFKTSLTLIK